MRIGVLGTGAVGRTLGAAIARHGDEVAIGTRDVNTLLARSEPGQMGEPPFAQWHQDHTEVGLTTFADAAGRAELVILATAGTVAIDALSAAGNENLAGKVLIDVTNPLDFSQGFPPSLFVGNTDSLGERIQAAFPDVRVVKTLNTVTAALMVDPAAVDGGNHTMFLCGNDPDAKTEVARLLGSWFGWRDVLDLGDIIGARAAEAYLTLWVRMMATLDTAMFNVKVVR